MLIDSLYIHIHTHIRHQGTLFNLTLKIRNKNPRKKKHHSFFGVVVFLYSRYFNHTSTPISSDFSTLFFLFKTRFSTPIFDSIYFQFNNSTIKNNKKSRTNKSRAARLSNQTNKTTPIATKHHNNNNNKIRWRRTGIICIQEQKLGRTPLYMSFGVGLNSGWYRSWVVKMLIGESIKFGVVGRFYSLRQYIERNDLSLL